MSIDDISIRILKHFEADFHEIWLANGRNRECPDLQQWTVFLPLCP